jgi:hypothetical protein
MDALSDVLRVAHLTGGVFLHAEFFEPWCMSARLAPEHCAPALGPASHLIVYHYVVEGGLHVRVGEEEEDLVIGSGEVVLLPRNDPHLMGSDLSLPAVTGSDIIHPPKNGGLASIHHGGDGRRTQMICGFLGCASGEGNPVLSNLPPLLKLNVEQGGAAEWIRSTFQYAAEEVVPRASVEGNRVRLTGVRNFDYRSGNDFTVHYEEREVQLSHLTGLDFYVSYWSEGPVAHTFVSFIFDNAPPLCISIETRPEVGEGFNPIASLFKQFELIYVVGEEHDLVGVRTNHRHERVYLYRLNTSADDARRLLPDLPGADQRARRSTRVVSPVDQ